MCTMTLLSQVATPEQQDHTSHPEHKTPHDTALAHSALHTAGDNTASGGVRPEGLGDRLEARLGTINDPGGALADLIGLTTATED